jgi:hypothetical protein
MTQVLFVFKNFKSELFTFSHDFDQESVITKYRYNANALGSLINQFKNHSACLFLQWDVDQMSL